jgi:hypothetical protein
VSGRSDLAAAARTLQLSNPPDAVPGAVPATVFPLRSSLPTLEGGRLVLSSDPSRIAAAPLRRRGRVPYAAWLAVAITLSGAAPSAAQSTPVVLQVVVVDATSGDPIPGVQVIVDGKSGVVSGVDGMADVPGTLGDSVVMEIRRVGYAVRRLSAYPTSGTPLLITIPLELAPVTLAPVRVEAAATPRSRELREFYARMRGGAGQFLTRSDIDSRRPRDLNDLFRMLPGIPMSQTAFGEKPMMEAKASVLADREGECSVQYFLDGTPILPQAGVIKLDVAPDEVEGIEIYRRGTLAPPRFQRQHGSCGVILIWKRPSLDG